MMRAGFLLLCLLAGFARAENFDLHSFETAEQEARFERLTHELRCPKCQNQSLADSNAPIATDLRERTYALVREGHSDEQIVTHLKARYGEFITYKPAFNAVTALLWLGPLLLLVLSAGVLLWRWRRAQGAAAGNADEAGPTATHDSVRNILERYDVDRHDDRGGRP